LPPSYFDEPHKLLIDGGDDLVEAASVLVSPMVMVD
jgi:hypothetical protein